MHVNLAQFSFPGFANLWNDVPSRFITVETENAHSTSARTLCLYHERIAVVFHGFCSSDAFKDYIDLCIPTG